MTPTSASPSKAPKARALARAVVAEQLLVGDDVDAIVRQRGGEQRAGVVEVDWRERDDVHGTQRTLC